MLLVCGQGTLLMHVQLLYYWCLHGRVTAVNSLNTSLISLSSASWIQDSPLQNIRFTSCDSWEGVSCSGHLPLLLDAVTQFRFIIWFWCFTRMTFYTTSSTPNRLIYYQGAELFCTCRSLGRDIISSSYQKSQTSSIPHFGHVLLPFQKSQGLTIPSFFVFGIPDSCVCKRRSVWRQNS